MPVGTHERRAGAHCTRWVGKVLEHFHTSDDVVLLPLALSKLFGRGRLILDRKTRLDAMQFCHLERLVREVDAFCLGAEPCHRLGENPAAAADIEHPLSGEPCLPVDPGEAQRIHEMQRPELPFRVPPPVGELAELGELLRVRVSRSCIHLRKDSLWEPQFHPASKQRMNAYLGYTDAAARLPHAALG